MGKGEEGVSTLLSRTTLAHAVAGSIGSILAMTLTYPLDRVRTYKQMTRGKSDGNVFQVLMTLVKKEGFLGIYDGLGPMLVALGTSNFVYFYWFTALKAGLQYLIRHGQGKRRVISSDGGPLGNLLLASIAGTLNVLITTPLWVAYTRLAVQNLPRKAEDKGDEKKKYSGVLDALRKIGQSEGVGALWSGVGPSLLLVSNPSVQFASYEWLKKVLLRWHLSAEPVVKDLTHFADVMEDQTENVVSDAITGVELSSSEYLALGALSKLIATILTYPIQVAQTRLRAEANSHKMQQITVEDCGENGKKAIKVTAKPKNSTFDCLRRIYNSDGVINGLYRGMEAKLLQTCLTSAFMFLAYEEICALILRFFLWRKFSRKVTE